MKAPVKSLFQGTKETLKPHFCGYMFLISHCSPYFFLFMSSEIITYLPSYFIPKMFHKIFSNYPSCRDFMMPLIPSEDFHKSQIICQSLPSQVLYRFWKAIQIVINFVLSPPFWCISLAFFFPSKKVQCYPLHTFVIQ